MEIEFGGAYTEEQVRRAIGMIRKPTGWGLVRRYSMPVLLLAVLGFLAYAVIRGAEVTTYSLVRTGTLVVLLGYYTLSPYLVSRKVAGQFWERLQRQGVHRGRADGRGVVWNGLGGETEVGWEQFARLKEDENMLVLVTEDGVLHMFPQAFFASPEDWSRFRQMVRQRVKVIH
jgi:hypothetical protein